MVSSMKVLAFIIFTNSSKKQWWYSKHVRLYTLNELLIRFGIHFLLHW